MYMPTTYFHENDNKNPLMEATLNTWRSLQQRSIRTIVDIALQDRGISIQFHFDFNQSSVIMDYAPKVPISDN